MIVLCDLCYTRTSLFLIFVRLLEMWVLFSAYFIVVGYEENCSMTKQDKQKGCFRDHFLALAIAGYGIF